MSILMGIMAVMMVVAIVSGHRQMMGGPDKVEKAGQFQESPVEDADKRHICDNCPAGAEIKDGAVVKEGTRENKIGEEAGK